MNDHGLPLLEIENAHGAKPRTCSANLPIFHEKQKILSRAMTYPP